MNPIVKLFLKFILIFAIIHGVVNLGFVLIDGIPIVWWKLLIGALVNSFIIASIMISIKWQGLKKNGVQEITSESMRITKTKIIKTALNKKVVMEKMKKDSIFSKMKIMETDQGISIDAGFLWGLFGEDIEIGIELIEKDLYEYSITSSSKSKITVYDNGKNLRNVNQIEKMIVKVA